MGLVPAWLKKSWRPPAIPDDFWDKLTAFFGGFGFGGPESLGLFCQTRPLILGLFCQTRPLILGSFCQTHPLILGSFCQTRRPPSQEISGHQWDGARSSAP